MSANTSDDTVDASPEERTARRDWAAVFGLPSATAANPMQHATSAQKSIIFRLRSHTLDQGRHFLVFGRQREFDLQQKARDL